MLPWIHRFLPVIYPKLQSGNCTLPCSTQNSPGPWRLRQCFLHCWQSSLCPIIHYVLRETIEGSAVVSAAATQQEGAGSMPGPFWVEFVFSPCVCVDGWETIELKQLCPDCPAGEEEGHIIRTVSDPWMYSSIAFPSVLERDYSRSLCSTVSGRRSMVQSYGQ